MSLKQEVINGKKATVAYLDKVGGKFVDPDKARVVIARFEDGSVSYLTPKKGRK